MNKFEYKNLTPFKMCVLENFPFIEADFDSITNYQLLCKVVKYVEEIGKNNNEMIKNIEELNNWFNNLDISEEVDSKLDIMAEDGTLERIINEHLFDKLNSSYIIDEIKHKRIYVLNAKQNVDIFTIPRQNEKGEIINIKHGFSDDIVNNTPVKETPSNFSKRKNATLCINASIFDTDIESANYNKIMGLIIHNGEVVSDTREFYPISGMGWQGRYILGLQRTGTLKAYLGNITREDILADDVIESWTGFLPLIINGENNRQNLVNPALWAEPEFEPTIDITPVYDKIYYTLENNKYIGHINLENFNSDFIYYEQVNAYRYPRQIIAQKPNLDIVILSCSGKGKTDNLGLSFEEVITILLKENCIFAYQLDEGGSVSSCYKNINLVKHTDKPTIFTRITSGYGIEERKVPDFIYFSKEIINKKDKDINDLYSKINELEEKINTLDILNNVINRYYSNDGLGITKTTETSINSLRFYEHIGEISNLINSILSNNVGNENGFDFYDNVDNLGMLKIRKNGDIEVPDRVYNTGWKKLAHLFKEPIQVTNVNTINEVSINTCLGSSEGAPFTDATWRNNLIITIPFSVNTGSSIQNNSVQIGFRIGTTIDSIAIRSFTNNTWNQWKIHTI